MIKKKKKNFCSWKRGVQIQYNVNQIELWCDSHQVQEGNNTNKFQYINNK